MENIRIGQGFDVHEFCDNRKLIIGGIEIPYEKGLLGHSDADVLLHAICDSLLGALALGDIGIHFPNTDPKFAGIDSKKLLKHVYELIRENGFKLVNLDSTLLLEKPKIAKYVPVMQKIIAEILEVEIDRISIKATTTEKLGFVGRKEGVAALSVALLIKEN